MKRMSEGRLTWVYVWKPEPGFQWRCYEGVSGLVVDGESQEGAIDHFNQIWNFRSPVEWKHQAPPRPKRPDDPKPASAAIEGDAISYHAIAKRLHPDLCGKRKFTADQVMQIINELRDSTRAKS
jgi:hypothetical protein